MCAHYLECALFVTIAVFFIVVCGCGFLIYILYTVLFVIREKANKQTSEKKKENQWGIFIIKFLLGRFHLDTNLAL
jgi:hypothetical protein